MRRRPFLGALLPATLAWRDDALAAVIAGAPTAASSPDGADVAPTGVTHRTLRFPADHGAHPDTHIEWWYVTGWMRGASSAEAGGAGVALDASRPPEFGFQVTFFRTRTDLAQASPSRFAARQLVFAHVALTDLAAGAGLRHDQRAAREGFGLVQTPAATSAPGPQTVQLRDWTLRRAATAAGAPTALRIDVRAEGFALDLALAGTQPLLLQGDAGYSQKGPDPRQASHYYSEPQLALRGRVERAGAPARDVVGRAWLDHEWSNELLPAEAVGWDWVGFNLVDGAALMAFRLRRADGSMLWAGGAYRDAGGTLRVFSAAEVTFQPLRRWKSPRTQADYPVDWELVTPAGRWRVAALLDDQELDSRGSTGSVYWEGVCALRHLDGGTAGWGYLELTGYAGKLRL
jgi:predicted secreted hydrolase